MNNRKEYCDHCEHDTIICGKCGNNTCNGGYGTVNGEQCDQCPSAYEEYQKLKFVEFASSLDEDKDYKIGTQENYEKFVAVRNDSLGQAKIKELAKAARELCYALGEGEPIEGELLDLYNVEFAHLILKEFIYKERPYKDNKFFARHYGEPTAYSEALAGESLGDWRFRSEGQDVYTVNGKELEGYARTVAYKVASNMALGYRLDPDMDPLNYIDCESWSKDDTVSRNIE